MSTGIGIVGAGKLGLPLAVRAAQCGFTVYLYDENPERCNPDWIKPGQERGLEGDLKQDIDLVRTKLQYVSMDHMVQCAEMIFVCVQTPHTEQYDGTHLLPMFDPAEFPDFDYDYLKEACTDIFERHFSGTLCVVSTVLPGTMERDILSVWERKGRPGSVVYSPQFLAMGTALADLMRPDIIIAGGTDEKPTQRVLSFFRTLGEGAYTAWASAMSIREAEAVKILYNTFISLKIGFVNSVQMIAHDLEADARPMLRALRKSRRITSPEYMHPGLGDGGGCHPRDNIALAGRLAHNPNTYNFPLDAMRARQRYADVIARTLSAYAHAHGLPICILGTRYKVNSPLTDGSHALLIAECVVPSYGKPPRLYDPYADPLVPYDGVFDAPHIYLLAVPDDRLIPDEWPQGSVVFDPWGHIKQRTDDTITLVTMGA